MEEEEEEEGTFERKEKKKGREERVHALSGYNIQYRGNGHKKAQFYQHNVTLLIILRITMSKSLKVPKLL